MKFALRSLAVVALCLAAAQAGAAEKRLYPSGPPHGIAYLRFANLSAEAATIRSAAAEVSLPAAAEQRVSEYDPVTPGSELTGAVVLAGKTMSLKVTLAPNEFVTVAIGGTGADGPTLTLLRDVPNEFNALKAALALSNLDRACAAASLVAGTVAVIDGIAPGKTGRRLVNPVNVALAVQCKDAPQPVPASLGQMAAGERYSVFLYDAPGGRAALAVRDAMAPFKP